MTSRRAGINPAITVEKIPIQPIPPPVEPPTGKPVTGLKVARLLYNLIVPDGEKSRLIPRGEIVDISLVPEHLRTDQLIEAPDEFRRNKVQLLHDMSCAVSNYDGERTVWREKLFAAHSLIDLTTLPDRIVEGMREGEDYLTEWNEDDHKKQEYERQHLEEELTMEEPDPDVGFASNPHLRYGDSL